jgi:hypothetical protein
VKLHVIKSTADAALTSDKLLSHTFPDKLGMHITPSRSIVYPHPDVTRATDSKFDHDHTHNASISSFEYIIGDYLLLTTNARMRASGTCKSENTINHDQDFVTKTGLFSPKQENVRSRDKKE